MTVSFRHLDCTAAPLTLALQLETVPLDVTHLAAVVANNFTTTGLGAVTGLLLDCAKVHWSMGTTPLIGTRIVAPLALVTGVSGTTRTTQATREHDGRVAPLRDQHRVFKGVRTGEQDLGADLIL